MKYHLRSISILENVRALIQYQQNLQSGSLKIHDEIVVRVQLQTNQTSSNIQTNGTQVKYKNIGTKLYI